MNIETLRAIAHHKIHLDYIVIRSDEATQLSDRDTFKNCYLIGPMFTNNLFQIFSSDDGSYSHTIMFERIKDIKVKESNNHLIRLIL